MPHLPDRHVVVFDFLGWGESDKPTDHDYTFANQTGDLGAVVDGLGLDRVVLVPHDASGLAAINWALDHPDRVAAIVALDTFYGDIAEAQLNPPEADPRRRPDARLLVGEARALATVRLRAPVKTAMLRQHPSA